MQEQWIKFCQRNNCLGNPKEHFEKIRKQYSIPKRFYHTFEGHIAQGLEVFNEFGYLCKDPDLIYFSWMNHDAEYDTHRNDNEEQSVVFAINLAREMQLPKRFEENSKNLILPTKHIIIPEGFDVRFHLDIDLSIFGQPEAVFDLYEENIRKEYEWAPIDVYRTKRAEILQMFADRNPLYHTLQIREKYEEKAKENLKRSIEKLRSKS
jgi:predicted metal-dependent HD superfamily phosphohydrolase